MSRKRFKRYKRIYIIHNILIIIVYVEIVLCDMKKRIHLKLNKDYLVQA